VRTIINGRAMMASLGLLATVSMAACSAHSTASAAGLPSSPTSATPAATAPATPVVTPAASPSPGAPGASAAPAGQGNVQNLVLSVGDKDVLREAFDTYKGYSPSPILAYGPYPGSAYSAYDPATQTYWAMATFITDFETDPPSVAADFKAGGGFAMFRSQPGSGWQVQSAYCPRSPAIWKFFPPAVLMAWAISTSVPLGPSGLGGVDC
jgi:hypothetical protein